MKHLIGILMLFVITCKVIEPALFAWQFKESSEAEQAILYDSNIREVKVYHPMPYHNNTEKETTFSQTYQEGDKFYNVVEQRYESDTFYIKIQENISVREQFFALGDAVKEIKVEAPSTQKQDNSDKSSISLEDLSKIYLPTFAPQIVCESWLLHEGSYQQYSNFLLFFSSPYISILTPPPNA